MHELAATCEFVDKDDQIRDRFVIGLLDSDIKRRLQLESELKLEKTVQDARQYEMIKSQMTGLTLATGEEKHVQEIKRRHKPNFKAQFNKHDGAQKFQVKQTFDRHNGENTAYECSKYGRRPGERTSMQKVQ